MATQTDAQKVVTGEVRLSFARLFEPHASGDDKEAKYSVMILVPKTDTRTIAAIERAQKAALEAGKAKPFGGTVPRVWKNTFRDGDEEYDTSENPEMAGMMFMTISSKADYPPGLVDRALRPIVDRSELYSGCYARVSMRAFPFAAQGNKGVSFGLNNVQKLRDGEPLGGTGTKAEEDFEALDDLDDDGVL